MYDYDRPIYFSVGDVFSYGIYTKYADFQQKVSLDMNCFYLKRHTLPQYCELGYLENLYLGIFSTKLFLYFHVISVMLLYLYYIAKHTS